MLRIFLGNCILLIVCCAILEEVGAARSFPNDIRDAKTYQIHAQLTFSDEQDTETVFIEEYHDREQKIGRLDMMSKGNRAKHFYYFEEDMVATINGSDQLNCTVQKLNQFIAEYGVLFLIMENLENGIIGPSAMFINDNPMYQEDTFVRGIPASKWTYNLSGHINVDIYFSVPEWNTTGQSTAVEEPLRVVLSTSSNISETNETQGFIAIIDFTYFIVNQPFANRETFVIPAGVGCKNLIRKNGMKADELRSSVISDIISYYTERVTLQNINVGAEKFYYVEKMVIDNKNKIRQAEGVDHVSGNYRTEILDFNTGLGYHMIRDGQCKIRPIYGEIDFESAYRGETGRMKEAVEILKLDHDFSYIGKSFHRNIYCDVYEAITQNNVTGKSVYTVYLMTPDYKTSMDPNEKRSIIDIQITTYVPNITSDDREPIIETIEMDHFDFRHLSVDHELKSIESCFPEASQKSYFVIYFLGIDAKTLEIAKIKKDNFIATAKEMISEKTQVSMLRLHYLDFFYDGSSITLFGEMLNRPPVLAGFLEDAPSLDLDNQENWKNPKSPEECAIDCLKAKEPVCRGFNYCKDDCRNIPLDFVYMDGDVKKCRNFQRAVTASNADEPYLDDALNNLQKIAGSGGLVIIVKDDTGKEYPITSTAMRKNVNPINFGGIDTIKYEEIMIDHQLDINKHTTYDIGEAPNIDACYQKCVDYYYYGCASFSYCTYTKKCRITSTYLILNRNSTLDEYSLASDCYIYRRKAIELFRKSPGKVPISREAVESWASSKEECALRCKDYKMFRCQGFEFCGGTKCFLSKTHILDETELTDTVTETCSYYFLDYSASFTLFGNVVVNDPRSYKTLSLSFNQCAKLCFTQMELECRSLNYCPGREGKEEDSECQLNHMTITDDGADTNLSNSCMNYEKTELLDDKGKTHPTISPLSSTIPMKSSTLDDTKSSTLDDPRPTRITLTRTGVESSTFSGAVVGMLFFGLLVGAMGFLGYSYYRSRRNDDGISVRFTKQT